MSGTDEFLRYLGAAGGSIALLFCLQAGFRGCLDIRYHDALAQQGASAEVEALRAREDSALKSADIEGAMAKIAKGRQGVTGVTPSPSDDLSAMSGWIYAPGHKTYEPEKPAAPTPAAVVPGAAIAPTGAQNPMLPATSGAAREPGAKPAAEAAE